MSTGTAQVKASTTAIGAIAATVLSRAIVRAVMQAEGLKDLGLPSHRDYVKS
jgi:L-aminopeptidase/D-esterase-like protein